MELTTIMTGIISGGVVVWRVLDILSAQNIGSTKLSAAVLFLTMGAVFGSMFLHMQQPPNISETYSFADMNEEPEKVNEPVNKSATHRIKSHRKKIHRTPPRPIPAAPTPKSLLEASDDEFIKVWYKLNPRQEQEVWDNSTEEEMEAISIRSYKLYGKRKVTSIDSLNRVDTRPSYLLSDGDDVFWDFWTGWTYEQQREKLKYATEEQKQQIKQKAFNLANIISPQELIDIEYDDEFVRAWNDLNDVRRDILLDASTDEQRDAVEIRILRLNGITPQSLIDIQDDDEFLRVYDSLSEEQRKALIRSFDKEQRDIFRERIIRLS